MSYWRTMPDGVPAATVRPSGAMSRAVTVSSSVDDVVADLLVRRRRPGRSAARCCRSRPPGCGRRGSTPRRSGRRRARRSAAPPRGRARGSHRATKPASGGARLVGMALHADRDDAGHGVEGGGPRSMRPRRCSVALRRAASASSRPSPSPAVSPVTIRVPSASMSTLSTSPSRRADRAPIRREGRARSRCRRPPRSTRSGRRERRRPAWRPPRGRRTARRSIGRRRVARSRRCGRAPAVARWRPSALKLTSSDTGGVGGQRRPEGEP